MDAKLILLFGGDSEERRVSVASAQAMAKAIPSCDLWFWHREGSIHAIDHQQLQTHQQPFINEFTPNNIAIFSTIEDAIVSTHARHAVFVLGVHGGSGENGYLQGLLEQAQIPFTGSSAVASRRAFDKIATKSWLKDSEFHLAPQLILDENQALNQLKYFFAQHQDMIVKPINGGSSIGNRFIRNLNDIAEIANSISVNNPLFVEKVITGQELSIGVIEKDGELIALTPTEIVIDHGREFDYEGKYLGLGTQEITPARVNVDITTKIQHLAISAHRQLQLTGYSRSDFIVADDGFYFLESNTLPGLAEQSLVPQQLRFVGIGMREFLYEQIHIAIRNHKAR